MQHATIDKDNPEWEKLYKEWIAQGKPGYITVGDGFTYRVLQPSDEDIKFAPKGAFDEMYGSSSAKGMTSHGR